MCIHVQRNGPASRMKDLCLSIPEDKRTLLAALIQLFSQVCIVNSIPRTYSDKLCGFFVDCQTFRQESH